ncbi:13994_t:CDS:2, partial [Funneliformis mosseae]
ECNLPPKKRRDANMVEVYSDLDSEDEKETYEEVYTTPKTSESQQEMRLRTRNVIKPIFLTTPMNLEEGISTSNVKKPRRKIPRTPSA